MKELKHFCDEFIVPQRDKPKQFGGTIPWCRIEDIQGKYLNGTLSEQYVSEDTIKQMNLKVIPKGAVICSCSASLGIQAIVTSPCITNQTFIGIVPNKNMYNEFLLYFLESKTAYLKKIGTGTTIPYISKKKFELLLVPDYSLSQQKQIAANLDKVAHTIDLCNAILEKLDLLVKSRFVEMFGDPITNTRNLKTRDLKDVLILKAGDFTPASDISEEPTEKNKYPCYGGNGIRGYVAEYNQEGEYSLVGRQGALSGNVQFAKGKFKNTEHALLVTPIIEMNSLWLYHLLLRLDLKRFQTGAAQPGLSVKNIQDIQIIIAPIEEQNSFAAFVEQTDKSKSAVKQVLEKAETLKKALMQEYFG